MSRRKNSNLSQAVPKFSEREVLFWELDVKALFLVSELSHEVLKRRVPKDTSPRQKQRLPEGDAF